MPNPRFSRTFFFGLIAVILILIIVFISNRSKSATAPTASRLQVTASFYPLYFFAKTIGGDVADVVNITPAGAEPHDYEPTARDIAQIEDSRLLILNGGKLEAWGDKVRQTLAGTDTAVISVGDAFADQTVVESGETARDPHVWLDPSLAKKEADAIAQKMEALDPSHADYFAQNVSSLDQELDALDREYRSYFSTCQKKDIVTSHAAFGYLARAYGLNQIPIAGLSPDSEPSPKQLADISNMAKAKGVTTIFFESIASPKLSETVAREIGAETMVLDPIEGLADADQRAGKNYFTLMKQNLQNLIIALQCQ